MNEAGDRHWSRNGDADEQRDRQEDGLEMTIKLFHSSRPQPHLHASFLCLSSATCPASYPVPFFFYILSNVFSIIISLCPSSAPSPCAIQYETNLTKTVFDPDGMGEIFFFLFYIIGFLNNFN